MKQIHIQEHALYRFFGEGDALLYVGLTVHLPTRLVDHHDKKPWWRQVERMTVQWWPSREAVVAAERQAIIDEKPIHNIQHNRRGSRHSRVAEPVVSYIGEFDYESLLRLPQFVAMLRAISDMGEASYGVLTDDDEWDRLVADAKNAAAFGDNCDICRRAGVPMEGRLVFPYRASRSEFGIEMHYRCSRCHHDWFSGYPDAPRSAP